jgi:hypothetical protein
MSTEQILCSECNQYCERAKKDENICRPCRNKKGRDRYYERKKKIDASQLVLDPDKTKRCSKCKQNKPETDFHLAKNKGVIRSSCIECNKKMRSTYYEKNKEKIIKQTSNYTVSRMKEDPAFKFVRKQRNRIYHAFTKQSLLKTQKTLDLLGCTPKELTDWLNFQLFDSIEMTLENYGEVWHIDHVKPCSSFDLSQPSEVEKCFHWTNLRPCLASENVKKSKNYSIQDLLFQELRVKIWLKSKVEMLWIR